MDQAQRRRKETQEKISLASLKCNKRMFGIDGLTGAKRILKQSWCDRVMVDEKEIEQCKKNQQSRRFRPIRGE